MQKTTEDNQGCTVQEVQGHSSQGHRTQELLPEVSTEKFFTSSSTEVFKDLGQVPFCLFSSDSEPEPEPESEPDLKPNKKGMM